MEQNQQPATGCSAWYAACERHTQPGRNHQSLPCPPKPLCHSTAKFTQAMSLESHEDHARHKTQHLTLSHLHTSKAAADMRAHSNAKLIRRTASMAVRMWGERMAGVRGAGSMVGGAMARTGCRRVTDGIRPPVWHAMVVSLRDEPKDLPILATVAADF